MASKKTTPAKAPEPASAAPFSADEREHTSFVDQAAIALWAQGWPAKTIMQKAEQLWAIRNDHMKGKQP